MPKIKVFVTLQNKLTNELLEKTYDGFLTNEKLVYKEDDRIVTIYKDSNTITMVRRELEMVTTLRFIKGEKAASSLEIAQGTMKFDTLTTVLEQGEKEFHICYETKQDETIMGKYDLKLHYEVRE